jgi:glucose/arabinose dehydrogenase
MKRLIFVFFALLLIAPSALFAQEVPAVPDAANYQWVQIVSGYDNPLYLTHSGDGSGRMFGGEQLGRIWIILDTLELPEPFLDISNLLPADVFSGAYTERGLLGLAFHPDFENNGMFFINYTDVNGDTMIVRYTVDATNPNRADPNSATTILTVDQPFANHNGGQLEFGPDGYLYIALGDGGDQGDPYGNAQNRGSLLGKILRIDVNAETYAIPPDNPFVDVEGAAPEVWAYGFRNPWRFSFDRATGDLYIADVGEWLWEEIDFQPADSPGGENYGWEFYEAENLRDTTAPNLDLVMPVIAYDHSFGCSVTGGYVYRGEALPELQGLYFYGDYCTGNIWTAYRNEAGEWQANYFMQTGFQISSFGEDEAGELYLVDYKGDIYRLEAAG